MMIRRAWGLTRLAISHAKLLEKIRGIFVLMHKQPRGGVVNLEAKKVVKQAKIFKIKLPA